MVKYNNIIVFEKSFEYKPIYVPNIFIKHIYLSQKKWYVPSYVTLIHQNQCAVKWNPT